MISLLLDEKHETAERLTDLDLLERACRVEVRQQVHHNSTTYTRRLTPGARLDPRIRGNRDPQPVDSKLQKPLLRRVLEDLATTIRLHRPHTPWAPSNDSQQLLSSQSSACRHRHRNRPTLFRLQQLHALHRTVWAARPVNSHLRMAMVFPSRKKSVT